MKQSRLDAPLHGPLDGNGPKYQLVFDQLSHDILAGKYKPGQRLPSEAALVRLFGTSRITIGRAVRELKERGLVDRVAGSGTYVRKRISNGEYSPFGLLIPDLGTTDIFEPICQGMAGAPEAREHALLWGSTQSTRATKEQALDLCVQYIERKVLGVFFAPLELTPAKDEVNQAIVTALEHAKIPIVLLDRCVMRFPKRCNHDLVGIDNPRAGYLVTDHLLNSGCRRLVFVAYPDGASTVDARAAGFREALFARGITPTPDSVQLLPAITEAAVKSVLRKSRPQGFVCVNDRVAGELMRVLLALKYRIPRDLRIVGIDDVGYAKLLPVPLTTIHQPCRQIGEAAMRTMIERVQHPDMLVRDVLLETHLVIRESSGGSKATH